VAVTVTDMTLLEAVLRRDRFVVVAALVVVIVVAWVWIAIAQAPG
jgi:predicted metal-binding membrane protein